MAIVIIIIIIPSFLDVMQLWTLVICNTPIIKVAVVYEFVYIVRSPGFEFPLIYYYKTSPGLRADLAFYINAWKASVLTKLDDDRATYTSREYWILNLNVLDILIQRSMYKFR